MPNSIDPMTRLQIAALGRNPRILIIYGSCREGSISKKLAMEAARTLTRFGADVELFDPQGLPLEGNAAKDNVKLAALHTLVEWADGQVWSSPEHHASMSGVMKLALDCFPTDRKGRSKAKGKALALMQVAGGPISCNALQDMQRAGRSMGLYQTNCQVALGQAHRQFDQEGRLISADAQSRLEDAMHELLKFAIMLQNHADWLRLSRQVREADAENLPRLVSA